MKTKKLYFALLVFIIAIVGYSNHSFAQTKEETINFIIDKVNRYHYGPKNETDYTLNISSTDNSITETKHGRTGKESWFVTYKVKLKHIKTASALSSAIDHTPYIYLDCVDGNNKIKYTDSDGVVNFSSSISIYMNDSDQADKVVKAFTHDSRGPRCVARTPPLRRC